MYRNTAPNANQPPQQTHPFYARVLPTYQRLLPPSNLNVYPYQSPPPQNGMIQPGLFLIDRGRKTIQIPGGLQVTIQTNPGTQTEASTTQVPTSSHTVRTVQAKNPQAPDEYRLLQHVLGAARTTSRLQGGVGTAATGTTTASRQEPTSGPQVNGLIRQLQSTVASGSSTMLQTGLQDRKRKLPTAAGDPGKPHQKPVFVRADHAGKSTADRITAHSHSSRNSSPTAAAQSQRDHPISPAHSRLVDTPKTSTKEYSDASGSGRKRLHDNRTAPSPSPQDDSSNPTGKALDRLSEVVWRNYSHSKQNTERLYMKENLRHTLEGIIQSKYPGSMLFLVGSSLNGFATNHSDTDLCLMVSGKELNQQHQAPYILTAIHRLLLQRSNFVTDSQVIRAKVPILKFVCSRTFSGLECDININNATGIRNTHLLQTYSKVDWRVAPLVILIKQWASAQGINDASQGTLSSYSLVLMVLNYLQVKCEPCVIPCLHQVYSSTFNSHSDVRYLYDSHPSNPLPSYITFQSKNTDTLWSLLRGFFDYYVEEFRFQTTVICVRLGRTYPLADAPYGTRDWISKYIYIEEPFDRNNTARAVFNDLNFQKIMRIFEKTHRRLALSGDSDSDNPEEILNLRLEGSSKDAPPVKKKKR